MEQFCCESTYLSGDGTTPGELSGKNVDLTLIPEFSQTQKIRVNLGEGGHGGGDPLLLRDIFDPNAPADPIKHKADHIEGAYSILTGTRSFVFDGLLYLSLSRNPGYDYGTVLGDALQ